MVFLTPSFFLLSVVPKIVNAGVTYAFKYLFYEVFLLHWYSLCILFLQQIFRYYNKLTSPFFETRINGRNIVLFNSYTMYRTFCHQWNMPFALDRIFWAFVFASPAMTRGVVWITVFSLLDVHCLCWFNSVYLIISLFLVKIWSVVEFVHLYLLWICYCYYFVI